MQEIRNPGLDFKMKPKFEGVESEFPFQVQVGASIGFFAGLDAGVTLLALWGAGSVSLLEASFLGKLEGTFALPDTQFAQPSSASKYEIKSAIEIGAGKDAAKALKFLDGVISLKPALTIEDPKPLATSPTGMLSAAKESVLPNEPVQLKVKMDASTLEFLGEDNLINVYIYQQSPGEEPKVAKSFPARLEQTDFTWTWMTNVGDIGTTSFWAATETFFAPFLPLEVIANSKVDVRVGEPSNAWAGTVTLSFEGNDTETMGDSTRMTVTTYKLTGNVVMEVESKSDDIFEASQLLIKSAMASGTETRTDVTTMRGQIVKGSCTYPTHVGTATTTRIVTGIKVPDGASFQVTADPLGEFYVLSGAAPQAEATETTMISESATMGGPGCPDSGTSGTHENMSILRFRETLLHMGMMDPKKPNEIVGMTTMTGASFPRVTMTAKWSLRRK